MAEKKLNINVRTKGTRRAKKEIQDVDRGITKLSKTAAKLSAAFLAAKGLISGFSSVVEAASKQELAEKKLEAALGKTSNALLEQAKALQQVTMFGDENIIEAQAMLAAFTDEEDQIAKLTEATIDLAAAKGFDLVSAADLVAKSFGSSTNALTRYGIEVKGAVGSTERLEMLTNNVAKLFGGQAAAQAETMAGSIAQMNSAIGDAAEAIGGVLSPAVITVTKLIKSLAEGISDLFEASDEYTKAISEMEYQNEQLNNTMTKMEFMLELVGGDILGLNLRFDEYASTVEKTIEDNIVLNGVWEKQIKLMKEQREILPETAIEWELFFKNIDKDQRWAISQMERFGASISQAAIYGQDMGDAVTSALKAIAAELASQLALWAVLSVIMPGSMAASGLGGGAGFLKFLTRAFGHEGGQVTNRGIQKYHSGGEVPAILQTGEFVLSREAVQSIGIDTARRINEGRGTGATINIYGGVVQDDYIRNELLPAINRAEELS